jgi:hypothetical protein
MDDIASLGFAIDTSSVKRAIDDVSNLASAAGRTERATNSMSASVNKATQSHTLAATVTQRIISATQQAAAASRVNALAQAELSDKIDLVSRATDEAYRSLSTRSFFRLMAREASLVGGPLGQAIGQFGILNVGGQRLGIGLTSSTIAFAAVAAFTYKAVAAFIEFEKHQTTVANVLAATRGASGQTVESLEALAQKLSANGTQSVADLRAAEVELLKYKAIGGDTFGTVLTLAKDVAATGFADLKAATGSIAKALKDPASAADALRKANLSLSVSEQRLAADLYNSGRATQAHKVILKAVSDQVSGSDARAADTLSTAWNRMSQSTTTLLEQWGKAISEGARLKDILNGISDSFDKASKPRPISAQVDDINEALERAQNPSRSLRQRIASSGSTMDEYRQRLSTTRDALTRIPQMDDAVAQWHKDTAAIQENDAASAAQKKRLDEVNDALMMQGRTAGMSAVQQQAYNEIVRAGVLGDKAAEGAIRGKVNALAAMADMRQIIDGIKQQTASLTIEAQTYGMSAGAAAAYRAEQEALAKEKIKGIGLGAKQVATIRAEAGAFGDAAQAAEKARVAYQIDFGRKTAFLSQDDVQIAQQLSGIYGNDVTAALNSTEAAQMRVNNAMRDFNDMTRQGLKDFVSGLLQGKSAMESLMPVLDNIAGKLLNSGIDNLLSGNPVQMAVGAVQAAVSVGISLFTKSQKDAEKAQQKLKEQEQAHVSAQQMLFSARGEDQSLTAKQQALFQQGVGVFVELMKSGLTQEAEAFKSEGLAILEKQRVQFRGGWEGMMASLTEGVGSNSPFTQATQNIMAMGDAIKSFVLDTASFIDVTHADQARQAGIANLLSQIGPQDALSDVADALLTLRGQAVGARQILIDLGMSADAAAAAIKERTTDALDKLTSKFTDDLQRQINDASGKGFLNEFADLFKKVEQGRADALALGTSDALVNRFFETQAQKIVDGAGLVGSAFTDLINQFPQLTGVIHESTQALVEQTRVVNANAKTIIDYVNGLLGGSNSSLSPNARFNAAQAAYNAKLSLAQGGNADAQASISGDFESYRVAAQAMFGSSLQYQQILSTGIAQLLALPSVTQTTDPVLSVMRDMLTAINAGNATQAKDATLGTLLRQDQLAALGLTTNSTIGAAIAALQSTTATLLTLPQAQGLGLATDTKVGTLLTRAQLDAAHLAGDTTVATLLTAAQLAQQGLASNAVVAGLLTQTQVDALGLAKNSTNATLLTQAQLSALGLATNTTVGTLLTQPQLQAAGLAANTTVATLLTAAQLAQQGLATSAVVTTTTTAVNSGNAALAIIQGYTQATKDNTASQASLQATQNSLIDSANSLQASANSLLSSINTLTANSKDLLALMSGQLSGAATVPTGNYAGWFGNIAVSSMKDRNQQYAPGTDFNSTISMQANVKVPTTLSNTMIVALNKIVANTFAIAYNTGEFNAMNGRPSLYGTFAQGGTLAPYALGIYAEHSPGGPRAIRAGSEPITFSPGVPTSASDAKDSEELKAIRRELVELKMVLSAVGAEIINAEVRCAEGVISSIGEIAKAGNNIEREIRFQGHNPRLKTG